MWWLIKNSYTGYKCDIFIDGQAGDWFYPQRGVHQGTPLSMSLYIIYINELLNKLKSSGHGSSICNMITTSPAHADDIALMVSYKYSLNVLLKIAYGYSKIWRYSFNTSKTELIIWGTDHQSSTDILFGNDVFKPNSVCKHMGITLTTNNKSLT